MVKIIELEDFLIQIRVALTTAHSKMQFHFKVKHLTNANYVTIWLEDVVKIEH